MSIVTNQFVCICVYTYVDAHMFGVCTCMWMSYINIRCSLSQAIKLVIELGSLSGTWVHWIGCVGLPVKPKDLLPPPQKKKKKLGLSPP